ncbi:hypothetical protein [uncultured Algibacter sp.]|uniref:hypothetical protein n=1 Tax=uncultured Algibacter sp. TaxID=298659 RepID=UPI00262ECA91|nr:hypothetical protein [uncultured Algibacter sp.]
MKNALRYFLLLILVSSCSKNDFSETKRFIEIDKDLYQINDIFEITILVYPEKEGKTIRFFKDYSNLDISFSIKKEEVGFNQELKKRFIEGPRIFGIDNDIINEYLITNTHPFEKKFKGQIFEQNGEIIFEIPKLNLSKSIDKTLLDNNSLIRITAYCETVYTSYKEYFIPKDIKIKLE